MNTLASRTSIRLPARNWSRIRNRAAVCCACLLILSGSGYAVRSFNASIERMGAIADELAAYKAISAAATLEAVHANKPIPQRIAKGGR